MQQSSHDNIIVGVFDVLRYVRHRGLELCRELAKETGSLLSALFLRSERTLNIKSPSPFISFKKQ